MYLIGVVDVFILGCPPESIILTQLEEPLDSSIGILVALDEVVTKQGHSITLRCYKNQYVLHSELGSLPVYLGSC